MQVFGCGGVRGGEGGYEQKITQQTNDFTDLCWNQSVCISVVFFCCNIFRGIFLIMENILGNSLGLHEFLIVFFFSREVILAQQFL